MAATEVRTAAQVGTEPKFQTDAGSGAVVGICIDIMRAIERQDPSLSFSGQQDWQPLTRIYSAMDHARLDASCGLSHSPERDKKYNYVGPVLFSIRYHLIARLDDPVSVSNWDDVRKLGPDNIVLANRGFAAVTILENAGVEQIDSGAASPQLNVQKLLARRGRFFFHRAPGLQATLNRTGYGSKLRILPTEMASSKLYFVVGKHVGENLIVRLRNALLALEKSGELERIANSWE
ncbi:transporter substrate-binding domain-containing protein [Oxalobacteraceae bacterium]|nr:transporter substrate-binding domain-containing protein [Oxalobacteraceae bacterium]